MRRSRENSLGRNTPCQKSLERTEQNTLLVPPLALRISPTESSTRGSWLSTTMTRIAKTSIVSFWSVGTGCCLLRSVSLASHALGDPIGLLLKDLWQLHLSLLVHEAIHLGFLHSLTGMEEYSPGPGTCPCGHFPKTVEQLKIAIHLSTFITVLVFNSQLGHRVRLLMYHQLSVAGLPWSRVPSRKSSRQ